MLNKSKFIIPALLAMGVIHTSYAFTSRPYSDIIGCAKNGDMYCQTAVGLAYQEGNGIKQDYVKAREWYTKAVNQGEGYAQFLLGVLYSNGFGVKQDYAKARELYIKAANQGMGAAQYNLGAIYYNGKGVKPNKTKAKEWFTKACKNEEERACQALNEYF
ncbi:tetratricopeptide repeat protein [Lonepinella sp. BR2919]|uniref:tetratricopeptide repeat protein n=1 Tax=unclassified Lonepinella TaxID=2642006 RepID=UPI003F6DA627